MPLPQPGDSENQADFVSRCMGDKTALADFPDQKQRVAVCYQLWRDRHKNAAKAAIDDLRETATRALRSLP
jgi:hypothetical protein